MNDKEIELLNQIKHIVREREPGARIVLYGSRARGNASVDSDWDILIILKKNKIEATDYDTISYPIYEYGWERKQQFSVKLYTLQEWQKRNFTPFYKNVERDGVAL
jgi:uncharacterized protein